MDDLNKTDVTTETSGDGESSGRAAIGTDSTADGQGVTDSADSSTGSQGKEPITIESILANAKKQEADTPGKEPKAAADDEADETDFESLLLAEDPPSAEKDSNKEAKADAPETDAPAEKGLDARLKELRAIADQLDALPENQDANFKRLRKLNRELTQTKIDELEQLRQFESFGEPERIREALTMLDALNGYDTDLGAPSTEQFAVTLAQKEPQKAYDLALRILGMQDKDGGYFAEQFTKNVLKLDPQRIADFQAISRGEVPDGYKAIAADSGAFDNIPKEYHDAFKRLTPKQRDIVTEGFDQYAHAADKAEALNILEESHKVILNERQTAERAAQDQAKKQKLIEDRAEQIELASTESISKRIDAGLDKIAFSADEGIDQTVKQAIRTQLFNLVHESPAIRKSAESYLQSMGIDIATDRRTIDEWFGRMQKNMDIAIVAGVKGQKEAEENAIRVIRQAEAQLSRFALQYASRIAKKLNASLRSASAKQVPANELPAARRNETNASARPKQYLDWRQAQKATAEGKALRP